MVVKKRSISEKWITACGVAGATIGGVASRVIDLPPSIDLALGGLTAVLLASFCVWLFVRRRREKREDRAKALAQFVQGRNVR